MGVRGQRALGWSSVDRYGPGEGADGSGPWECHRCRPLVGCSHHPRAGWGVVVGMGVGMMVMTMVEVMAGTVMTRMTSLGRTAMARRPRVRMERPTEAAETVREGRVT
jgi:serine acetyltransferase